MCLIFCTYVHYTVTKTNRGAFCSYCVAEVTYLTGKTDHALCATSLKVTMGLTEPAHLEPPTSFIKHSYTQALISLISSLWHSATVL